MIVGHRLVWLRSLKMAGDDGLNDPNKGNASNWSCAAVLYALPTRGRNGRNRLRPGHRYRPAAHPHRHSDPAQSWPARHRYPAPPLRTVMRPAPDKNHPERQEEYWSACGENLTRQRVKHHFRFIAWFKAQQRVLAELRHDLPFLFRNKHHYRTQR